METRDTWVTSHLADPVRVEHSVRHPQGSAGGAGQDRHGELHRQAGGGEGRAGEGGELKNEDG